MKLKEKIRAEFNNSCFSCKVPAGQVHHVLSKSRFPQFENKRLNLVLLCERCHRALHQGTDKSLKKSVLCFAAHRICEDLNLVTPRKVTETIIGELLS
jgi:hypothetical protein